MSNNLPTPNLGSVITSARARKIIYAVYVVALVVAGGAQVYFGATSTPQPTELAGAIAVLVFLGIPIGGLAVANTSTSATTDSGPEHSA